MKTRKGIKRLALLLTTLLLMSLGCVMAWATATDPVPTIDTTKTGSITVTKYVGNNPLPNKGNATGQQITGVTTGYATLDGVTFVLVRIADQTKLLEYYDGTATVTTDSFDATKLTAVAYDDATNTNWTATYDGNTLTNTDGKTIYKGVTANGGQLTFTGLPLGIYVLREMAAPDQVASDGKAEDSVISVPMVNTMYASADTTGAVGSSNKNNAEWMYDIYVYPKNKAKDAKFTLTKYGADGTTKLGNIAFKLYKADFDKDGKLPTKTGGTGIDWKDITDYDKTTTPNKNKYVTAASGDKAGTLTVEGLQASQYGTQYMLVEDTAVNGYIADRTPLYFTVDSERIIKWNAATGDKNGCDNTNIFVLTTDAGKPTVTDNHQLTFSLKNERPELTKKVYKNGTEWSDTNKVVDTNWDTHSDYRIDDIIYYRIQVNVPRDIVNMKTFVIEDVPVAGLKYVSNSVVMETVKAGTETADQAVDNSQNLYTVTEHKKQDGTTASTGFTIKFDPAKAAAIAGRTINVYYQVKMTENANIENQGNDNTATLYYSTVTTAPANTTLTAEGNAYTITDKARVVTYQYEVNKKLDSETGNAGVGVEFKLIDSGNKELSFVEITKTVGSGADEKTVTDYYRLAIADDTTTTKVLKTDADGKIVIKGLEAGKYNLKETKTVEGYNLLSKAFEITVEDKENTTWGAEALWGDTTSSHKGDGTTTGTVGTSVTTNGQTTPVASQSTTVVNKKGFVLPQTGSFGSILFGLVGIVLVAGGLLLLFGGRKRSIR